MRSDDGVWVRKAGSALLIALLVITLGACAQHDTSGRVKLTLADSYPTTHMFAKYGVSTFMKDVQSKGKDGAAIDYYPGGQLGDARDIASLTRTGSVDIAPVAPSYLADQLPLSGVSDLPGLVDDSCTAARSLEAMMRPGGVLYEKEYKPRGFHPLWVGVIPSYEIFTATKKVARPEDLKGLTIRSAGGAMDYSISALGVASVSMPAADAYEALSRHTVDGLSFPNASIPPYKLEEVLKYATEGLSSGSFAIPYVISQSAWDSLTDQQQATINKAAKHASQTLCHGVEKENPAAKKIMQKAGVKFVRLKGDGLAEFRRKLAPVPALWAKNLDAQGKQGSKVLKTYKANVKKFKGAGQHVN